jgi:hypothetical protein
MKNILAAIVVMTGAMTAGAVEPPRTPVLLELFTSEGCSSCPPADQLLEKLDRTQPVHGAELIVLSEHVDYWDRMGWKDPFSLAEMTSRQQQYSTVFHIDEIFTPQLVIDGKQQVVGTDSAAARKAVAEAIKSPKAPLTLSTPIREGDQINLRVEMPASSSQGVLYVVLAENSMRSQVLRGENAGHSLSYVAVVRKLIKIGTVKKDEAFMTSVQVPVDKGVGAQGLRIIAFLQDNRNSQVLAVVQQKL